MKKNRSPLQTTLKLSCWICALLGCLVVGVAQDRSEGWVVRQTENGLVKVPARQYFRFEGLSLSGKAYTPFQAVFDQRPARRSRSLIPVRNSFKREVLDASGYSGR